MGAPDPTKPYRVYYIDTFEDSSGPGRDGWGLMASFEDEAEALAFARKQANRPQPGAGTLADRLLVICAERGEIFSMQRPG
jgi:hypothetical protein